MERADQEFLQRTEEDWLGDYQSANALAITPADVLEFVSNFSDESPKASSSAFNYDVLYDYLTETGEFSGQHDIAIWWIGERIQKASVDRRAATELFICGYSLAYRMALETNKIEEMQDCRYEDIVWDAMSEVTDDESAMVLVAEAAEGSPLLYGVADDLLDKLVAEYNSDLHEEASPIPVHQQAQVRNDRLAAMRAGIGLAYRHCRLLVR